MGDWGANGTKTKMTVQDGDSWESLASRAGLNQRQFEDLMRANPNIMQLKAGQTISLGGLRRNDNAYVSNYTAGAEGMMQSGQLQSAYAANGTGGVGSPKIQKGTPVAGGNFGYNTTTKGGRSELAWQNNYNNPTGAAAVAAKAPPALKPLAGAAQGGLAPVGYGNNIQPASQSVAAPSATPPSLSGQAAASQWMQQSAAQKQAGYIAQGNALEAGMAQQNGSAAGGTPTPAAFQQNAQQPQGGGYTTSLGTASAKTFENNMGYIGSALNSMFAQPKAQAATPATANTTDPVAAQQQQDATNAAAMQQKAQQVRFTTNAKMSSLKSGLLPPSFDANELQNYASQTGQTVQQVQTYLMSKDYGSYVPGLNGSLVQPGNMTANGGPNLVPSAPGAFAGTPAYTPPVYNTYPDLPAYQGPPAYYQGGGGGYGRGGGGGGGRKQPAALPGRTGSQSATWRIG